MDIRSLDDTFAVSPQLAPADLTDVARAGFASVICHRPDGEEDGQPSFEAVARAAAEAGVEIRHQPIGPDGPDDEAVREFEALRRTLPAPVLAYCRSGRRSASLWALSTAGEDGGHAVLARAREAGHDLSSLEPRLARGRAGEGAARATREHDIVVVGAGAAGIAVAASLLSRDDGLDIAIVEPADTHYYQPGWTMVGAGVFDAAQTARPMDSLIPAGATRIRGAVAAFEPERDRVVLEDGGVVAYRRLIVCPGLELDWGRVEGLSDALGRNGVTSNYRYDLAPYTWEVVQGLKGGQAVFTQPPMPIKCAGAPQKAMYLSADHWRREGRLADIDVAFHNAGPVLFGVAAYVPALMEYVERYGIALNFGQNLVAVDGDAKRARFETKDANGAMTVEEAEFDMLHVCPPQCAPDFVRRSELANEAGWVGVDQGTLRHERFANVWSLGDVCSAPNAKTAAAARKQAPIVAANVLADIEGRSAPAAYDGYGSCPLTVERGKIVLAEFGYGGKLLPSFPSWVIDGQKPSRLAWELKAKALPPIYWHGMLKGREWMASPEAGA